MIRDKYETMNTAWPATLPPLTGQEAISAVKRLRRFAGLPAFKGKWVITTGNRNTWTHSGEYRVNAEAGWKDLVHLVSHHCNARLNPTHNFHAPSHLQLERAMISYVVDQGWLTGALRKPEKPKPDLREVRRLRIIQRIATWQTKAKRAATALKKLRRQQKYYERITA